MSFSLWVNYRRTGRTRVDNGEASISDENLKLDKAMKDVNPRSSEAENYLHAMNRR